MQEVLLTVWRSAGRYDRTRASAATWIFTIARNKHVDRVRRASRDPADRGAVDPPEEPAPDQVLCTLRSARQVREALAKLPDEQRVILEATFFEFQSQELIATRVGAPIGTVKSRTRLGLKRLRTLLEES